MKSPAKKIQAKAKAKPSRRASPKKKKANKEYDSDSSYEEEEGNDEDDEVIVLDGEGDEGYADKMARLNLKAARGDYYLSELGGFESDFNKKDDDDDLGEGGADGCGGVVAVTSTDANEEEVDDIGNGCGDSYDDSAVKADSWDKRKKGKIQFKKKQEMGEQRKAKNFLPEPSDKVLRAYAKSDMRIAQATEFMGKKHGVEMEERQTVIAEKQEEIYGEYGYQKAYQNIQGQFNRICEALGIDSGEDEASILKTIGEMVETMIDDGEEGGGKVKLKVGKTEKQQGAGGKMKIEALKKGKQVEIVKVEGGVEEVF